MAPKSGHSGLSRPPSRVHAVGEAVNRATALPYIGKRNILGGQAFIYEDLGEDELAELGEIRTPTVSDLFMAKVGG